MKKNLLLFSVLLGISKLVLAQDYISKDTTLQTGNYNFQGWGNVVITIPKGANVHLICKGYGAGDLVVNGNLAVDNNNGDDLQIGGSLSVGNSANLSINGSLTTSKDVEVSTGAAISITGNYTSDLQSTQTVHLMNGSKLNINGNSVFNAGGLLMDAGSIFNTNGDMTLNNSNNTFDGTAVIGGTFTVQSTANKINCPGSITTNNLINTAGRNPDAFEGSGFIKITGNFEAGSGNPLTNDPTIVVDYNKGDGDAGSAKRGTTSPCTITKSLGIKLSSFTGSVSNESIVLKWTTSSESNNKGFNVESSTDGINFKQIGFVNSNTIDGNSTVVQNYTFTDPESVADNFYRLKQVDWDGSFSYSYVINIPLSSNTKPDLKIYPVPAISFINVASNTSGLLKIYDQIGRTIIQQYIQTGITKINLSNLTQGIYYYNLNHTRGSFIKK